MFLTAILFASWEREICPPWLIIYSSLFVYICLGSTAYPNAHWLWHFCDCKMCASILWKRTCAIHKSFCLASVLLADCFLIAFISASLQECQKREAYIPGRGHWHGDAVDYRNKNSGVTAFFLEHTSNTVGGALWCGDATGHSCRVKLSRSSCAIDFIPDSFLI